jgi:hypothetical protein
MKDRSFSPITAGVLGLAMADAFFFLCCYAEAYVFEPVPTHLSDGLCFVGFLGVLVLVGVIYTHRLRELLAGIFLGLVVVVGVVPMIATVPKPSNFLDWLQISTHLMPVYEVALLLMTITVAFGAFLGRNGLKRYSLDSLVG